MACSIKKFFGEQQTPAEKLFNAVVPVLGPIVILGIAWLQGVSFTTLQWIVLALLASDLVGGVFTNATAAAKRSVNGPDGVSVKCSILFNAGHIHPFIVAWLFYNNDWFYGAVIYLTMMILTLTAFLVPLYLRRAVMFTLYGLAVAAIASLLPAISGMEWFVPVYLLKLVIAHAVKEEAYEPSE